MRLRALRALVLFTVLGIAGAQAQGINDMIGIIGGAVQSAVIQSTQAEWRRLPRLEIDCVDRFYLSRGSSLQDIIRQGITPDDGRNADARRSCRSFQPPNPAGGTGPTIYVVDGLALGEKVRFDSQVYQQYQCSPSNQYPGFTWCQRQRTDSGANGNFNVSTSILHAGDGTAVYINRYIQPAFFKPGDIDSQIESLSRRYRGPSIQRLPAQNGLPAGVIVTWGNVALEQMPAEDVAATAAGRRSRSGVGIPIDYLGDFQKSARLGLPLFRIIGGDGYIWSASYDESGRGHLRFLAANASQFTPIASQPQSTPPGPSAQPASRDPVAASREFDEQQRIADERTRSESEQRRLAEERAAAQAEQARLTAEAEAAKARALEAEQRRQAEVEASRHAAQESERKRLADVEAANKAAAEAENARMAAESARKLAVQQAEESARRAETERDARQRTLFLVLLATVGLSILGLIIWLVRRSGTPPAPTETTIPPVAAPTVPSPTLSTPNEPPSPPTSDTPDSGSHAGPVVMEAVEAARHTGAESSQQASDNATPRETAAHVGQIIEQICQIAELHRQGTVTAQDYEKIKARLINSGSQISVSPAMENS